MKSISVSLFSLLLIIACSPDSDRSKSFKRFVKHFKPVELPMGTNVLYRVHNSDLVTTRIDTTYIQEFISPNYKLKVDAPVYDGYAYAVKLPKEKALNYQGLIYYLSKGQSQYFILNTYSLDGELKSSIPLSGDSSSYQRQTCYISEERLITIRKFLLHQKKDENMIEYFYQINKDGMIDTLGEH